MIKMMKLTKSYRVGKMETLILKGIDLNINKGEFVSICGPSGSGKTTLLNILGCLDSFDQGTFLMFDNPVQEMKESERTKLRANHIGFVFQDYYLIDHLTVEENIKTAQLLGDPNHQLEIDDLLEQVGMSKHKHKYPQDLSGGEKQRVAIARAIINLPDLILADEPTGNLDHENTVNIMMLLKRIHETYGNTIVMVTHDEETTKFSNRILRMRDGVIVSDEKAV